MKAEVKAQNLIGPALDWAAAKANGASPVFRKHDRGGGATVYLHDGMKQAGYQFDPSKNWNIGGPITQQEKISVWWHEEYGCWCAANKEWMDADPESEVFLSMLDAFQGSTPLIAAMRCFVYSKLGEEVDIPEELTCG